MNARLTASDVLVLENLFADIQGLRGGKTVEVRYVLPVRNASPRGRVSAYRQPLATHCFPLAAPDTSFVSGVWFFASRYFERDAYAVQRGSVSEDAARHVGH